MGRDEGVVSQLSSDGRGAASHAAQPLHALQPAPPRHPSEVEITSIPTAIPRHISDSPATHDSCCVRIGHQVVSPPALPTRSWAVQKEKAPAAEPCTSRSEVDCSSLPSVLTAAELYNKCSAASEMGHASERIASSYHAATETTSRPATHDVSDPIQTWYTLDALDALQYTASTVSNPPEGIPSATDQQAYYCDFSADEVVKEGEQDWGADESIGALQLCHRTMPFERPVRDGQHLEQGVHTLDSDLPQDDTLTLWV